ncbi:MAG: type II toxin-antitoxin system Phd/YefM family antitoxin [Planctomycetaceae bacterium]
MPDNTTNAPSTKVQPPTLVRLEQLRESGQPIRLTINGTFEFIVQDDGSFDRLCDLVDRLETIEGVQRGLDDLKAGRGRPLEEMIAEKRAKYGL